jgi:hypothetical protein
VAGSDGTISGGNIQIACERQAADPPREGRGQVEEWAANESGETTNVSNRRPYSSSPLIRWNPFLLPIGARRSVVNRDRFAW